MRFNISSNTRKSPLCRNLNLDAMQDKSRSSKTLVSASLKMGVATLTSRLFGLVREQLLALYFGASGLTDAFLVAYRIPNLLRDLFAEGAFSAAFVPNFTEARLKSKEEANRLLWSLFFCLLIITGLISLAIFFLAEPLVALLAPSFEKDPEKLTATVNLTKIMAPFLVMVSVAALFMGALNTFKIFFIPAMAPAVFNMVMIGVIVGASFWFPSSALLPVEVLGLGVFLGGLVQVFMQLPKVLGEGLKFHIPRPLIHQYVKKVFAMLGPGMIGFAATQINLIVNTILATGAAIGAVSWLNFAFRLFQFPVGVLGISIANSNLVYFSTAWKANEREEAIEFLNSSYHLSLLILILCTCMMLPLSEDIVTLVYQRGKFSAQDSAMTAEALRYYLWGLPFYGVYKIFVPTFYTLGKPKVPVVCSILSILVNIGFCVILVGNHGFSILSLGASLSIFTNAVLQSIIMRKYLRLPLSFFLNWKVFKIVFSGSLVLAGLFYMENFGQIGDQGVLSLIISILLKVVLALSGYILSLVVLGEFNYLKSLTKSR